MEHSVTRSKLEEGPRDEDEVRQVEGLEEGGEGRRGQDLETSAVCVYQASALPYPERVFAFFWD